MRRNAELKNVLEKELKENGAERLFYDIEMPLVPVLVNIERNGVLLDTEALKQSSAHFTEQMERIEKEIYDLAGETFNIASPKQVGEVLFDKLKIVEKPKRQRQGNMSLRKRFSKVFATNIRWWRKFWNTAD